MLNFDFCNPTHYIFGKDRENEVGSFVKQYGGSKVLIHYGGGSVIRSGLLERVEKSLKDAGLSYCTLGGVQPNPRNSKILEGIDLCRKEGVDFILAVGGGSTIDSSKGIAMGAVCQGDFFERFYLGNDIPEAVLPIGTVLTIAAAGSEGSFSSVVTRDEDMLKRSCDCDLLYPKFSILDPALTETLPPYQTASGCTDIMAHVLERYVTNTTEVSITDHLCEGILRTIIAELPKALENPHDYGARANIMWAGTVAHNNVVGVGREQDWASHMLEHELSGLYDCAHGAGLAVIFPAWMEYVLPHNVDRFVQLAVRVWGCEMDFESPIRTAKAGINAFRNFLHSVGMPTSFQELGAREEDIPTLVEKLHMDSETVGHFVPLYPKDSEAVYRLACR